MLALDDEQQPWQGVLLLDDCECAVGVDRVPLGARVSAEARAEASRSRRTRPVWSSSDKVVNEFLLSYPRTQTQATRGRRCCSSMWEVAIVVHGH
jgi:hypothetical protein